MKTNPISTTIAIISYFIQNKFEIIVYKLNFRNFLIAKSYRSITHESFSIFRIPENRFIYILNIYSVVHWRNSISLVDTPFDHRHNYYIYRRKSQIVELVTNHVTFSKCTVYIIGKTRLKNISPNLDSNINLISRQSTVVIT